MSASERNNDIAGSDMVVWDGNHRETGYAGTVAIRVGNTTLRAGPKTVKVAHEGKNLSVDIDTIYSLRNPIRNKEVKKVLNRIDQCSLVNGWEILWIDNSDLNSFIENIFGEVHVTAEEMALMSLWRMGGVDESLDMSVFGLEGKFEALQCGVGDTEEYVKTYLPYLEVLVSEPVDFEDLDAAKYDVSDDVCPRVFNHGLIIDLFGRAMANESPECVRILDCASGDIGSAIEGQNPGMDVLIAFNNSMENVGIAVSSIFQALVKVADYCKHKHLIPYYSEISKELTSWDVANGDIENNGDYMGVRVILYQFGIHTCSDMALSQLRKNVVSRGSRSSGEDEIGLAEIASLHFYTIYRSMKISEQEGRNRIAEALNFQDLLYQEKTKYNNCPQLALVYRWWLKTKQRNPRPELLRSETKFRATITMLLEWIKLGMESNSNEMIVEKEGSLTNLVERIFLEEVVIKSKTTSLNSLIKRKVVVIGRDVLFYDFMKRKICVLDSRFVEQILTEEGKMYLGRQQTAYELLDNNLVGRITARIIISLLYKTPYGKNLTGGLMEIDLEEVCSEGRMGHKVDVSLSEIVAWAEKVNLKNNVEKSKFIRDMLLLLSKSGCSADKFNSKSCYNKVVTECSDPLHTMNYDVLVPLDGLIVEKTRWDERPKYSFGFTGSEGRKFTIVRPVKGRGKSELTWKSEEVRGRVHIIADETGEEGTHEKRGRKITELVTLKGVSAGLTTDDIDTKQTVDLKNKGPTDKAREQKRKETSLKIGVLVMRSREAVRVTEDYSLQEECDNKIKILVEKEYGIKYGTSDPGEVFKRIMICRKAEEEVEDRRREIEQDIKLAQSKSKQCNPAGKSEKKVNDSGGSGSKSAKPVLNLKPKKKEGKTSKEIGSKESQNKSGRQSKTDREKKIKNRSNTMLEVKMPIMRSIIEKSEGKYLKQEKTKTEIKEKIEEEYGITKEANDYEVVYKRIMICREAEKAEQERKRAITHEINVREGKLESVKTAENREVSEDGVGKVVETQEKDTVKKGISTGGTRGKTKKKLLCRKQERKLSIARSPNPAKKVCHNVTLNSYEKKKRVVRERCNAGTTLNSTGEEDIEKDKVRSRSEPPAPTVKKSVVAGIEITKSREEVKKSFLLLKHNTSGKMRKVRRRNCKKRRRVRTSQGVVKVRPRTRTPRGTCTKKEVANAKYLGIYRTIRKIAKLWKSDGYYGNRPKLK